MPQHVFGRVGECSQFIQADESARPFDCVDGPKDAGQQVRVSAAFFQLYKVRVQLIEVFPALSDKLCQYFVHVRLIQQWYSAMCSGLQANYRQDVLPLWSKATAKLAIQ